MYLPLDHEPEIEIIDPPRVDAATAHALAAARERVMAHPHWFNGATLMCDRIEGHVIHAYCGDFAHALAHRSGAHALGIGPLAASLDLTNTTGAHLVTRGPQWLLSGGWRTAAGGFVEPEESPRDAALREAQEEIGLGADALADCSLVGMSRSDQGVLIGYRATCTRECTPALPSAEVLAWEWVLPAMFEMRLGGPEAELFTPPDPTGAQRPGGVQSGNDPPDARRPRGPRRPH